MKAAVLGSPIAHSLSPALHRAAYAALGLDGWSYQAIECDEAGLPGLLAGCGPSGRGCRSRCRSSARCCRYSTHIDPVAAATGGANTVVFPTAPGTATTPTCQAW